MATPRTSQAGHGNDKSKSRMAKDFIAKVRAADKLQAEQEACDAQCASSLQGQCGTTADVPYNQIEDMRSEIMRLTHVIENQEAELLGLYRQVAQQRTW